MYNIFKILRCLKISVKNNILIIELNKTKLYNCIHKCIFLKIILNVLFSILNCA